MCSVHQRFSQRIVLGDWCFFGHCGGADLTLFFLLRQAANHFERPESQYRPTPLFVTHRRSDPLLPMFEQEADALRQLYSEHTEDFVFKTIDKSVDVLHGPVEARAMFEFLAPRMSQRHIALEEMVDKKEIQRIN
eukprot:TRINITY_DN594_c0_g1_i1.p2 TRINITY_DN594_c0_g1~~TRINITY_DN594_c0_g1_i1.p2  ORF type:complete len:135 (-),score=25.75 TRINITY_DN594_c0_g1_i1:132-536(-)